MAPKKAWMVMAVMALWLVDGGGVLGQKEFGHEMYSCDDPAKIHGLRIERTLDYVLCKVSHEKFCEDCRCEFEAYYQTAQVCFDEDIDYQFRVFENAKQWKENYLEMCIDDGAKLEETGIPSVLDGLPRYSLDPNDDNYCNSGQMTKPNTSALVLFWILAVSLLLLS